MISFALLFGTIVLNLNQTISYGFIFGFVSSALLMEIDIRKFLADDISMITMNAFIKIMVYAIVFSISLYINVNLFFMTAFTLLTHRYIIWFIMKNHLLKNFLLLFWENAYQKYPKL